MKYRTRFSKKIPDGLYCPPEENKTKPEFIDECDINKIMAKYRKTGVLPENARQAAARYGDFSSIPTYMQMQERIIAANELFAELPAVVRKQFDNDPGVFLAASETQEGRELLIKLGLGKEMPANPPSQPPIEPDLAGQAIPKKKNWKGSPPPGNAKERL